MLDLDQIEALPEYEVKYKGNVHKFDPVILVSKLAAAQGVTDPGDLRVLINKITGLDFTTERALLVLQDFEKFSVQWEERLKNLFGRSDSSSTTTTSVPTNTPVSTDESDAALSST